jgi:regulator of RNase E activity RraA
VRQGGESIMPFAANVPVGLCGVTVFPGDWIYADASGAVVIPPGDVRAILEDAARIEERDAAEVERLREVDALR